MDISLDEEEASPFYNKTAYNEMLAVVNSKLLVYFGAALLLALLLVLFWREKKRKHRSTNLSYFFAFDSSYVMLCFLVSCVYCSITKYLPKGWLTTTNTVILVMMAMEMILCCCAHIVHFSWSPAVTAVFQLINIASGCILYILTRRAGSPLEMSQFIGYYCVGWFAYEGITSLIISVASF